MNNVEFIQQQLSLLLYFFAEKNSVMCTRTLTSDAMCLTIVTKSFGLGLLVGIFRPVFEMTVL
jgi:hypothetical protein